MHTIRWCYPRSITALVIAFALCSSASDAQATKKPNAPANDWIKTSMTAIDNGSSYLLVDWVAKTIVEFPKDDVKAADARNVEVRSGTKLLSVRALKGKAGGPGVALNAMLSEDKHSQCVGLVEICCGSGRALRGCLGGWDCGHSESTCDH